MRTLEQRRDRAVVRWETAVAAVRRGCHAIDCSRWLVSSSCVVLDRPHRLIRGGAPGPDGADSGPTEVAIRGRIRTLLEGGVLPKLSPHYIGVRESRDGDSCVACSRAIRTGEREFIVAGAAAILYFHRRCMELWASEAQALEAQPQDR